MTSACALIVSSVNFRRSALQLLQPIGGVLATGVQDSTD